MQEEIVVSIICNTYNQVSYIEDALDGFLMQKTTFSYEILVHDDASTDGTAEIIKKYENKYPDIVKPFYQSENQYSKGESVTIRFQYPRVKGKYIAFCEGDDYWTDEYKLQRQYELMESYPQIGICAHSVNMVDAETKNILHKISPYEGMNLVPIETVIKGAYVGTCSLMFRKEALLPVSDTLKAMHFDYTMRIQGAAMGGMLYMDSVMASYRYASRGSWTERRKGKKANIAAHERKVANALKIFDEQTGFKYSKTIENEVQQLETLAIINENENALFSSILAMPSKNKRALLKIVVKRIIGKIQRLRKSNGY